MKSRVTGLDKVLKQLDSFGKEGNQMAIAIVQSTADNVVADAKRNAPGNLGKLKQSIHKVKEAKGFIARVVVGVGYAIYVEVGTGTYVRVPPELQDIAIQYKGQSKGTFEEFLQAIKDWIKQKGIGDPDKLGYIIAMSILRKGIRPQPFLYPAYVAGRKKLLVTMRTGLNQLVKKYNSK